VHKSFSESPLRGQQPTGSAVAPGTIRGVRIARWQRPGNAFATFAWNRSGRRRTPKTPSGGPPSFFVFFCLCVFFCCFFIRGETEKNAGTAVEPQRNVMLASDVLDGGGTSPPRTLGMSIVRAGSSQSNGDAEEDKAQVPDSQSSNDPRQIFLPGSAGRSATPTGACGVAAGCTPNGLTAGAIAYFLYPRAATTARERDMIPAFRSEKDAGKTFTKRSCAQVETKCLPMSAELGAEGAPTLAFFRAWENARTNIFAPTERMKSGGKGALFGTPRPRSQLPTPLGPGPVSAKGHPLAWTEGHGLGLERRRPRLAILRQAGQPTKEPGGTGFGRECARCGYPPWSSAVAGKRRNFCPSFH